MKERHRREHDPNFFEFRIKDFKPDIRPYLNQLQHKGRRCSHIIYMPSWLTEGKLFLITE